MNEQLSCWVDGELDELAAARVVRGLADKDGEVGDAAMAFLIGDAIRGDMSLKSDFMQRFGAALDAEPTVIAPGVQRSRKAEHVNKRFFALSAAASVAAFMVVGWFAVKTGSLAGGDAVVPDQVAKLEAPARARSADSARMQQYMAMHQELSSYQAVAFNTVGQ